MRLLSLIFVFIAITSLDLNASDEQTVVLISLDGFRWDYIEKHGAKNIAKIAEQGVRGRKMRPVYPTKTFPNHLSIITGLLPINHGVVDNRFCDRERSECYSMGKDKDDSTWFNGIPLWNLASMQGLVIDEVNNLDVYPLIAKVLGIKILSEIDSDGKTLQPALK